MKLRYLPILIALAGLSSQALADEKLANKSGCIMCHQVSKKSLGPSFKNVAAKYKGDAEAAAKLEKKVREGGSGSFGSSAMPATDAKKVSDEDIKKLVAWILSM